MRCYSDAQSHAHARSKGLNTHALSKGLLLKTRWVDRGKLRAEGESVHEQGVTRPPVAGEKPTCHEHAPAYYRDEEIAGFGHKLERSIEVEEGEDVLQSRAGTFNRVRIGKCKSVVNNKENGAKPLSN